MKIKKPLDKYDDPKYEAAFKEGWHHGYEVGYRHALFEGLDAEELHRMMKLVIQKLGSDN